MSVARKDLRLVAQRVGQSVESLGDKKVGLTVATWAGCLALSSVDNLAGTKAAWKVWPLAALTVDPKVVPWVGQKVLRWVGTKVVGMAERMASPTVAWRVECWVALSGSLSAVSTAVELAENWEYLSVVYWAVLKVAQWAA